MSIDIQIEFTISDVLLNIESLEKKNKYTCPICYEFIHNKSIYQCKSGHIACQECWEKSLNSKQECMICRIKVYSLKDLARCLVIEQAFGKKECCCIYSFTDGIFNTRSVGKKFKKKFIKDEENGCKEILKVEDFDSHVKNCQFKFIQCSNKGCKKKFRSNTFGDHENQCTFKLGTCEICKKNDIVKNKLKNHNKVCPKVKIDCSQDCQMKIERDEMNNHIENDCENTIVNCKYHEQGCQFKMKRSQLQNHLENVNHQFYMSILIEKLISIKNKMELEFKPLVYKNTWTISNYSRHCVHTGGAQRIIESPKITIFSNEFQIYIFPLQPSIFLFKHPNNVSSVKVEISFTIINVLDNSKSKTENIGEKVYDESNYGFGNLFSSHPALINKENGWLSEDDKLTVEINIKLLDQTFKTLQS
ncbi:hypothetical protein ACTFIZ_011986 [Dictyostelium cf. discoideum]